MSRDAPIPESLDSDLRTSPDDRASSDSGPGTLFLKPPEPPGATLATRADGLGGVETPWVNLDAQMAYAARLIASGYLPASVRTPAQAIVIMQMGRELGLPPMQAFRQIHVIAGRPTMSADLMRARMLKGGIRLTWVKTGDDGKEAVLRGTRRDGSSYTGRYTLEMARAAGLLTKDPWRKNSGDMLRARVTSQVARMVAADLLEGMIYTPEEMGAEVTPQGEILNVSTGAAPTDVPEYTPGPVEGPLPRTAAEWVTAFEAAEDAEAVATLRREAKASPMSLEGSIRVTSAWLDAKQRTAGERSST